MHKDIWIIFSTEPGSFAVYEGYEDQDDMRAALEKIRSFPGRWTQARIQLNLSEKPTFPPGSSVPCEYWDWKGGYCIEGQDCTCQEPWYPSLKGRDNDYD
jgi:hypothetical protein